MLLTTGLASAASVSTFGSGDSEASIELRGGQLYDANTGAVSLPEGETVNAAGLIVNTDYAEYQYSEVYDTESTVFGDYIWNPLYNGGFTTYDVASNFDYQAPSISLTSQGFNTNFEGTNSGFGRTGSGTGDGENDWELGMVDNGQPIPRCGLGEWCWGTNFDDNNYRVGGSTSFEYQLLSAPMIVHQGKTSATFKSYHSLYFRDAAGANNYYYDDCAYVVAQNSTNGVDWNAEFIYVPIDISLTTGISVNSGLQQRGTSVNQVTTKCDYSSFPAGANFIAGNSFNVQTQTTAGWATVGLDLSAHEGTYVRLKFILERNDNIDPPANATLNGWYIDAFRLGDALPSSGELTFSSFAPSSGARVAPDGYGLLNVDASVPFGASLQYAVIDPATNFAILDRDGRSMSGLTGSLVELFNIDTATYPSVDLRFNYQSDSGGYSTPILNGISLGTRVGTGLNASGDVYTDGGFFQQGKWTSEPMVESSIYWNPNINDDSYSPSLNRYRFSKLITAIKPIITDSCQASDATVKIQVTNPNAVPDGTGIIETTPGTTIVLDEPVNTFGMQITYDAIMCEVTGIHADLTFGYAAVGPTIDIGGDGDIEWGMTEPAFGGFGHQTLFRSGSQNGVNIGSPTATISLSATLDGQGGTFMLPKGADVQFAEVAFDSNTIGALDISMLTGQDEEQIASFSGPFDRYTVEQGFNLSSLATSINNMMPTAPTGYPDIFGNEWVLFRFKVDAPSGTIGSSVTLRDLTVMYTWSTAISDNNNVARELSQGVALGTAVSGFVTVPIAVASQSGGAVRLSSLSITTSQGHDSTLALTGSPTGLYTNGEIYEVVTTHEITAIGQTLAGASLLFETSAGSLEVQFGAENGSFWEVEGTDPDDWITLLVGVSSDVGGAKEVKWRFRVNPEWQDTESVRIYTSSISSSNVLGLPAGVLLDPALGNAVENDAGIRSLTLFNDAGIEQPDLDDAKTSRSVVLVGTVRLEDLNIAPDPASYYLLFEQWNESNTTHTSDDYFEIDRLTMNASSNGNFSWNPAISTMAAGTDEYRLRIGNYTSGDLICPPAEYNPDQDCSIRFTLSIDPLKPQFVNISVETATGQWRELSDNTWIPSDVCQKFRVFARDNPVAPETLTLNYWVENDHDVIDRNGLADVSEYQSVPLIRQTETNESYYLIDNQGSDCINDIANSGDTVARKVSLYVSGSDVGGNYIDGGGPGFGFDQITYIGMESRAPIPRGFRILDDYGIELTQSNNSLYAGNTYHLRVQGTDDNGWGDIQLFTIDLNTREADDMVLYYNPLNDTAWTESQWIEILTYNETGQRAEMVQDNEEGGLLLEPFETQFVLDLPIRLAWSISTVPVGSTNTPDVYIKDRSNIEREISGDNYKQRWSYATGIQLDVSSFEVADTVGYITPDVGNPQSGFVYKSDMLKVSGTFAFKERLGEGVIITPEIPLSIRIDRPEVQPDFDKGFDYAQAKSETHQFENGTFEIFIQAPEQTNQFQYTFELEGLPTGAVDHTQPADRVFYVNVDSTPPRAANMELWKLTDADGVEISGGEISSSDFECLTMRVYIEELQRLDQGDIQLNWMFFKDGGNWTEFYDKFPGRQWMSEDVYLVLNADPIKGTVACFNLWNASLPDDFSGVSVRFWVSGQDSSGLPVKGAGNFESAFTGGEFGLRFEAADFQVNNVLMNTNTPAVGRDIELIVSVENGGNIPGKMSAIIVTEVAGSVQNTMEVETPDEILPGQEFTWRIAMGQWSKPQVQVRYTITDLDGAELGSTQTFVVLSAEDASSGLDPMIIGGVVGLVVLLIAAVIVVMVVLNRGGEEEEDEYYEDEDFLPEPEQAAPLKSRAAPPIAAQAAAAPAALAPAAPALAATPAVDPRMAEALLLFTFWDEATIQGYFDMGWDIPQLQQWLSEQN